jgi:hypothetical protein
MSRRIVVLIEAANVERCADLNKGPASHLAGTGAASVVLRMRLTSIDVEKVQQKLLTVRVGVVADLEHYHRRLKTDIVSMQKGNHFNPGKLAIWVLATKDVGNRR